MSQMSKKPLNFKFNSVNPINNPELNKNIKNSDILLKLFCCLTIVVFICILIGQYAFKNGILTCDHYIFNTYLYIVLAILLTFIVVLINDKTGIFTPLLIWMLQQNLFMRVFTYLIIIIIFGILIITLFKIDPNNILASNAIWSVLILLLGIFIIPIIWFARLTDVVGLASIGTIIITLVVGLLGYYYGDKIITFDWDVYLNYALITLIIVSVTGSYFITDYNQMMKFYFILAIISLVIFILLLLSNHKKLKENSDKCIDGKVVPNYPVESFGLFIKILNIFKDLVRILGTSKN